MAEGRAYWHCQVCDLRYLEPSLRLDRAEEKGRYHLHEPGDAGYLKFVEPLLARVRQVASDGARGLDFGAGRVPVLAETLRASGYDISVYDPFFWPEPVKGPFDFIVACEVVEHLYNPRAEFVRLREALKPGGALSVMTDLVQPSTDFSTWYYRRDPTHVVFYSARTFAWICDALGFSRVLVEGRVVTLWLA